jgi:hypothetical protein
MNSSAAPNQLAEGQKQEALRLTSKIKDALRQYPNLDAGQQHEADQCLAGLEERLRDNCAPHKTQFDDLMKVVGGVEPLTRPALQLGEMFGYLPAL